MSEPWNFTEAQRRQFREAHAEAKIRRGRDAVARAQWITPDDDPLVAKRGHTAELPCLTHWPIWRRTCSDCRELPPELEAEAS